MPVERTVTVESDPHDPQAKFLVVRVGQVRDLQLKGTFEGLRLRFSAQADSTGIEIRIPAYEAHNHLLALRHFTGQRSGVDLLEALAQWEEGMEFSAIEVIGEISDQIEVALRKNRATIYKLLAEAVLQKWGSGNSPREVRARWRPGAPAIVIEVGNAGSMERQPTLERSINEIIVEVPASKELNEVRLVVDIDLMAEPAASGTLAMLTTPDFAARVAAAATTARRKHAAQLEVGAAIGAEVVLVAAALAPPEGVLVAEAVQAVRTGMLARAPELSASPIARPEISQGG